MANVGDVQVCVEVSAETGECTATAWMPPPTLLPPMTVEEASMLAASFALLWGTAYVMKLSRRTVPAL